MQQSAQLQLDEGRAKAMTARFNAALTTVWANGRLHITPSSW
jgi:hypothetical protein